MRPTLSDEMQEGGWYTQGVSRFILQLGHHQLVLKPGSWRVGRATTCEIRLRDAAASRVHATLHVEADQVWVEDHGSRNGLRINGQRVWGVAHLEPGDKIAIAGEELRLLADPMTGPDHVTRPLPALSAADADGLGQLSARERAVFERLAHGETHREIATQLEVSIKTIETYRARINLKLGLRTRADLVRLALRCGVLAPN